MLIQKNTGRTPVELQNLVELPRRFYELWQWFIELHNARSSSGFGVNPISYSDIKAYFELIDIVPEDWEIRVIKKLDGIAQEHMAKQAKKATKANKPAKK